MNKSALCGFCTSFFLNQIFPCDFSDSTVNYFPPEEVYHCSRPCSTFSILGSDPPAFRTETEEGDFPAICVSKPNH